MSPAPAVPLVDDAELMRRIQDGDEQAFATLFDRRGPALLTAVLRIVPDRMEAESVLLESFTQAWREADRYTASRGSVVGWLFVIARSRALDFARSSVRTLRLMPLSMESAPDSALATEGPSYNPAQRVEDAERVALVAAAMATLSEAQRAAIELAFFEGLTHTEVADRLNEPLGTIKSRIRLAMQRLRRALHAEGRELAT